MILIFGQKIDPHIVAVANALTRSGNNFTIVDSTSIESGVSYWVSLDVAVSTGLIQSAMEQASAIWWRQKPTPMPSLSVEGLYDHYFVNREWNHLIDGLGALTHAFEVNSRSVQAVSANKVLQLKYAQQLGFRVPRTLVSNDADAVILFMRQHNLPSCIYKTFTPYMPPSGAITFSTLVDEHQIIMRRAELALAPGIFQEFIPKAFELRVTVVGDDVFTARVSSTASAAAEVDWRRDQLSNIFSSGTLDETVLDRLHQLQNLLGLHYCAYDLIVSKTDEVVFLEANPTGQWMWLEEKIGLPISSALGAMLANKTFRPQQQPSMLR